MLRSLLTRWFGRPIAPPSLQPAVSPQAAAEAPTVAVRGARRPMISARGEVAGYEFHVGVRTLQPSVTSGALAATAYVTSLLLAVRLCTQSGRVGFAELPVAALDSLEQDAKIPPGIMISLQFEAADADHHTDPKAQLAAMRRWRAAGARLGWHCNAHGRAPAGEQPDFLVLSQGQLALVAVQEATQALKAQRPGMPLIVLDVESIASLEKILQAGADFACCALALRGDPGGVGQIAPQAQRVLQVLNAIVQDAPIEELVAGIKADVSLSYRLLRFLNSASFGRAKEIGSIQQAVVLLGRDELYRWLSVLLVRASSGRTVSDALQEMALARARLLELLAQAKGEARPGEFFTLGLASMLGELLATPLATVVASLQLPAAARNALLDAGGPWYVYLQLAEAVGEPDGFALDALAGDFGGSEAVLAMSEQAWAFAADPDHAG